MHNLLFDRPIAVDTVLALSIATPVIGIGAAQVSARLANNQQPSARQVIWTIAAGALLAASVAVVGPPDLGWSLGLGWSLIVLGGVDLAAYRLPDVLTFPLMGAGMLYATVAAGDVSGHAAGLVAGYVVIALSGWIFARLRRRQGVGLGDAKLFAVAGAWLGWAALPSVMLISCAIGFAWFAVVALAQGRQALREPIPFGVPLCFGIWSVWLMVS